MTKSLKIIKVGNSFGVVLPKEVLAKLGVAQGDLIDLIDDPEGGVRVRRHDGGFAEQMQAARDVMRQRREALAELAK